MSKIQFDAFGPSVIDPAEDILDAAWDAPTPAKQCTLARRALDSNIHCIDAYVILALHAKTHAETIALLRSAVLIGDKVWREYLDDPEVIWWGHLGTRPFMRAMHNLSLELANLGEIDEAEALFKKLLRLNPEDNQGIRYLLLRLKQTQGNIDACEELLATYSEDWSIEFLAAELFIKLLKGTANKSDTEELDQRNSYVLNLLSKSLQNNAWPKANFASVILGSQNEAKVYLTHFRKAWQNSPTVSARFLELTS